MFQKSSSGSRWPFWCALLLLVVFFLVGSFSVYSQDSAPQIVQELTEISKTLGEASTLLNQGLSKVEQAFEEQDQRLQQQELRLQQQEQRQLKLEERLQKAENQLQQAEQASLKSGEELQNSKRLNLDLEKSFADYKKKVKCSIGLWQTVSIVSIIAAAITTGLLLSR